MQWPLLFGYKAKFVGFALILMHIPLRAIWERVDPGIDKSHQLPDLPIDSLLFTSSHLFYISSTILVLGGLFLIAFSKEKIEDEQIAYLRLQSLHVAMYFNYFVLLLTLVLTNGVDFIDMLRIDIWLPLIFFILTFRFRLFRSAGMIKTEQRI